jgi:hypothetical protein
MGARSQRPASEDTAEVQALTDSERAAQQAVLQRAEMVKARFRALKRSLSPAGGLPVVQRPKPGPASPVPPAPAEPAVTTKPDAEQDDAKEKEAATAAPDPNDDPDARASDA